MLRFTPTHKISLAMYVAICLCTLTKIQVWYHDNYCVKLVSSFTSLRTTIEVKGYAACRQSAIKRLRWILQTITETQLTGSYKVYRILSHASRASNSTNTSRGSQRLVQIEAGSPIETGSNTSRLSHRLHTIQCPRYQVKCTCWTSFMYISNCILEGLKPKN